MAANLWAIAVTFGFAYTALNCILIIINVNAEEDEKVGLLYKIDKNDLEITSPMMQIIWMPVIFFAGTISTTFLFKSLLL